jgi:nitroimidazol reductase NimA-like FMN-containing flavoprotein (pyridoxamine 5'-phosphate oxidase superfamily)
VFDSSGLEVLSREDCLRLLAATPVGRIVFTRHALPAVEPVNFILDGETIVIRTGVGSKLVVAARNAVVAFEIDEIDIDNHSGWSVTVVGHAEEVHDTRERQRLARLPLRPWAPGERDHFIRIQVELINGRRFPTPVTPASAAR